MSIHWPGCSTCSNASCPDGPSGTNWTLCCHGTGKRLQLRKPTTPHSVCVRAFAQHRGCRATGTDHANAQVDPPYCISPADHTPSKPSNVGRVQRLRARCVSTPRWLRAISIIRLTAACCASTPEPRRPAGCCQSDNGYCSQPPWCRHASCAVKLLEAENQIVIDYEVYAQRPNDADLLISAIQMHVTKLGRVPHLLAADAGFYSAKNEVGAQARGVKRVCIPNRSTKSAERRREQKKRWFRNGQRWRTGCEGRIGVSKRRHGLNRFDIQATME